MRRLSLALLLASGCGRIGYEPMALEATPRAVDGGSGSVDASVREGGADARVRPTDSGRADARVPAFDGGRSDASPERDGGTARDGGPPTRPPLTVAAEPCIAAPLRAWTFDSLDGTVPWEYVPLGTTDASLFFEPIGALGLDVRSVPANGGGGWIRLLASPETQSRHIHGAVWTTAEILVKPYAQAIIDGTTYAWADGGGTVLTPGSWHCLSVDTVNPVYKQDLFDPNYIAFFGFELVGLTPFTVYVDQVAY